MTRGTTASAAAGMVRKSNEGPRKGPSNKNLNSRRRSQSAPGPMVSRLAGRSVKGPDKGAG